MTQSRSRESFRSEYDETYTYYGTYEPYTSTVSKPLITAKKIVQCPNLLLKCESRFYCEVVSSERSYNRTTDEIKIADVYKVQLTIDASGMTTHF